MSPAMTVARFREALAVREVLAIVDDREAIAGVFATVATARPTCPPPTITTSGGSAKTSANTWTPPGSVTSAGFGRGASTRRCGELAASSCAPPRSPSTAPSSQTRDRRRRARRLAPRCRHDDAATVAAAAWSILPRAARGRRGAETSGRRGCALCRRTPARSRRRCLRSA